MIIAFIMGNRFKIVAILYSIPLWELSDVTFLVSYLFGQGKEFQDKNPRCIALQHSACRSSPH